MSGPGFKTLRASPDGQLPPIGFDAAAWRLKWFRHAGSVHGSSDELVACYSLFRDDKAEERAALWSTVIGTPGAVTAVIAECNRAANAWPFDAADWRRRFVEAGGWLYVDERHGGLMVGLPEPTANLLVELVAEKDANPHARSALYDLFGTAPPAMAEPDETTGGGGQSS